MAELESGLITIADLRDGRDALERGGSFDWNALDDRDAPSLRWELEIASERTEFTGLTLVTITVRELEEDVFAEGGIEASLRQLVALHDDADESFEEDPVLRGLPEARR